MIFMPIILPWCTFDFVRESYALSEYPCNAASAPVADAGLRDIFEIFTAATGGRRDTLNRYLLTEPNGTGCKSKSAIATPNTHLLHHPARCKRKAGESSDITAPQSELRVCESADTLCVPDSRGSEPHRQEVCGSRVPVIFAEVLMSRTGVSSPESWNVVLERYSV